ncbi:MAG: pyridoxal phosphate-dependent aminotransferase [Chloroflexales bacterium]|nr:pyridoxal phosphate-dependent aminotransferase [Chloroflexales bacterium]
MPGFLANADLSANPIELRRQQITDYIDLTSSNPTRNGLLFPPDILAEAAAPYWHTRRYQPNPRGLFAARQAIAGYYAQRTPALTIDPAQDIFVTASTSEAYALLFALLTNPGDNVLAPQISYPLFEYLAEMFRIELRSYPLDPQRGWRIDPWQLARLSDERTRAVLIVSPHNPTGMVVKQAIPVLQWLGLPIICDEVFAEMPFAIPHVPPLAAVMPNVPIFTLNGISKMYALPDLKLGWAVLNPPAQQYADRLEVLNDTLLGANALTQSMLPTIMHRGHNFVVQQRQIIQKNIATVMNRLASVDCVRVRAPDAGYYLFIEVLTTQDEEAVVLQLLDAGVFVHPGFFFGFDQGCFLVLSCLVAEPQLSQGVQRLVDGLRLIVAADV